MQYYPQMVGRSGIPTHVLGVVLLIFAAKGLFRKSPYSN